MAEYNIQMNRYVSASDSYDQLFPKTKIVDVVDQNGDNLDTLLADKQDEILISGILKGNGAGGISAAVAGTDYVATNDSRLSDARTPTAHNQAASTITAGTFGGQVVANTNGEPYSVYCLRNQRLANADTTPSNNGEICWTYG